MNLTDSASQLENIADQWVTSFLGLQKCSKFIIEDDNVLMVNCPLQLLENVNFKDPLGDVLLESLQSFHTKYGCGINSFLCMWCTWNKGIRSLLKEDVPLSCILETLSEGLKYIINSIKEQEISLQFVIPSLFRYMQNSSLKTRVLPMNNSTEASELLNVPRSSIIQQNRHFLYSYRLYNDEDSNFTFTESCSRNFFDRNSDQEISNTRKFLPASIKSSLEDALVEREMSKMLGEIAHGAGVLVSLISDLWKRQMKNKSTYFTSFCKDNLVTLPLPGYKFSYSTVVDGIICKLSSCTLQDYFVSDESMFYRSLLVGGDVTPNYVHLGFSPNVSIKKVANFITESDDDIWLHNTIETLHKLKVSSLLVEGMVDERLVNTVCGSILVISHVPHNILCALAKSSSKNVISYIENSNEANICNVAIEPFQVRKGVVSNENIVRINAPGTLMCQSVIICHEVLCVAHQLEHTFWHLVNRLCNICTVKKLLPGRGETEKFCIRKLQELSEKTDENHSFKVEILNVLSEGFNHYANKIDALQAEVCTKNDVDTTNKAVIYDDPLSKIEGWEAALKLALLLSQVDSVIINGLSETSDGFLISPRITL